MFRYCAGGSCLDLVNFQLPTTAAYLTFLISQMKSGVLKEEYIAIIARELLRGLEYLHDEGKLHRDIKGWLGLFILSNMQTELSLPCSCQYPPFR
jgi:serine/threonine-protein kinase 24/25/MST4